MLPMPQLSSVHRPHRPLPDLLGRLVARINQDVFVSRPRYLPLCFAKQHTIEQYTSVRCTVKDLEPAFLSDSFKPQVPLRYLNFNGERKRSQPSSSWNPGW